MMKTMLGIVLCVLGVVGLAWGGVTYSTRKKVFDMGALHVSREKTHHLPVPPILGGLALIAGVVLLAADRKRGTP